MPNRTDQHTFRPTPAPIVSAAAMYAAAADRYEAAAVDADEHGQYARAAGYRLRAMQNRELATECAQDDDPNSPWLPKIPGPRKPGYAPASTPAGAR